MTYSHLIDSTIEVSGTVYNVKVAVRSQSYKSFWTDIVFQNEEDAKDFWWKTSYKSHNLRCMVQWFDLVEKYNLDLSKLDKYLVDFHGVSVDLWERVAIIDGQTFSITVDYIGDKAVSIYLKNRDDVSAYFYLSNPDYSGLVTTYHQYCYYSNYE